MSTSGSAIDTSTPARQRLVTGLLGWGEPRPRPSPDTAAALRGWLEEELDALGEELTRAAATRRSGSLLVSKSGLDRLACDGWALEPEPYTHSPANVRGVLAHAAIAADLERSRRDAPDALVARVWDAEASRRPGDPASLSSWLNACDAATADALRDDVAVLVATFREVWPPLPEGPLQVRIERPLVVRLAAGRVTLRGLPDLVIDSRRRDGRARSLVVDLKTGRPRSEHDRHELRFYALLETLATQRVPFRWATFYVTEGRYEAEDLREATLEVTARRVLDGVRQQVRLHDVEPGTTPPELTIRAGAWCRWCLRASWCEVAAAAATEPDAHDGGLA